MGKKAGIILASPALILMLLSTALYASLLDRINKPTSGEGLLGALALGILLAMGIGAFALSSILYLAAFLASRRVKSTAIGVLFTAGGILALINFLALLTIPLLQGYHGPPDELAIFITLTLTHAIIGSSLIITGTKATKTK